MEKLPRDKTVYIERGLVYQDMGNHSYAIEDFHKAAELDPQYALSFFYAGVSKIKLKMVSEAIQDFEKAILLDENLSSAFDGLGQCYQMLGDTSMALENYQKALNQQPTCI
jgi:tetratricopeptide (TPR) repeat protein